MTASDKVCVFLGDELGRYAFGQGHPFGPERYPAFVQEFKRRGLDSLVATCRPVLAQRDEIERFHTSEYVDRVMQQSASGEGFLDYGDTPAFCGVYEASAYVVGTTLAAIKGLMEGHCRRVFVPIAGLHHARRDSAAGFCVFNDCGVAIETLRAQYGIKKIAYVDIDAHHGDGVFYAFEHDPDLIFADIHEDGQYLYPGTGAGTETGKGEAVGCKLNIALAPDAGDEAFMQAWPQLEAFVREHQPQIILLQCGADSLAGDPITHLRYTAAAHAHAASRLCRLADECCEGRLLGLGGGGYNLVNLADAWNSVIQAFVDEA